MDKKEILTKVARHVKAETYDESTGHDWWHIKRVYDLSAKINQRERRDEFVIRMIALLHDIYDDKFSRGDIREDLISLLKELQIYGEIDGEELENILHSIEHLGFKGGFNKTQISPEGQVVQDADRLDAIGAIGIARVFAYGGKKGLSIYNPDQGIMELNSEEEYRNVRRHSVNHFYEKLLKVKDTMNTGEGKKIAIKRTAFMEDYLQEFFAEWNILEEKSNEDIERTAESTDFER